jgi:hypothetical protein
MCSACDSRPAISDSGLCGPCLRGVPADAPPIVALQDRILLFHSWASCPGLIVSELVGPEALSLKCAECGHEVGRVEPGLLDEFLALVPTATAP